MPPRFPPHPHPDWPTFKKIASYEYAMETRSLFLVLGLAALLLSGCISIDYTQKLDRDGNSVMTETIDMSVLLSAGSQYASASDQLSGICVNITKGETDVNCTYRDGVINVSKVMLLRENQYNFSKSSEFPYTVYTLEIRKLPELIKSDSLSSNAGSDTQTDSDFKASSAKLGATTLKTAGASLTYSVEMPGDIISAENGEIAADANGKKYAKFDVLELMTDGKYLVVKSKELDMPLLALIGGGVVLLVGGIAVAVVLMKAMKK
jgi:hypothetical protein